MTLPPHEGMKNVTAHFQSYRECVRHLWNLHFLKAIETSPDKWTLRDTFDDVCSSLFAALVIEPLHLARADDSLRALSPSRSPDPIPMRAFHVVPNAPLGVPIHVNRAAPRTGYWDHPPNRILPGEAELHFVRWFDFDQLDFRDFRYYEVQVATSSVHPEIVGRAALIECEYASIYLQDC